MKGRKYILLVLILLFLSHYSETIFSQNILKLPSPVNSEAYNTIAPYMSYDGNSIVFIMETEFSRELVECKKNIDGTWSGPVKVDAVNKFDTVEFYIDAPVYNHNVTEIYFSLIYETKDANSNLYVTRKQDGEWIKPEKLPAPVNSSEDETDPFLSADCKFLFFAKRFDNQDMKKIDCYQIFVSEKKNDKWQKPLLLPDPVNSGCDKSPRMSADGKTLYFSSIRNEGKTGSDIYYAKKITKNAWMSPVPIDTLYNAEDESYPCVPLNGETIFYQQDLGKGKKRTANFVSSDLEFRFQPEKTVHFYGIVSDLKTNKPLSAKISIIDPNTSIILSKSETNDKTGEYSIFLQKGRKYRIVFFKENYSHFFFTYSTMQLSEFMELQKNIKLFPDIDLIVNVYDNEIYEPLAANLFAYDAESGEKEKAEILEISKGRFSLILPIGKHYRIEAEKTHFENNFFNLELRNVVQFSEFERDIELQVKKVDYVINLSDEETGEGVEAVVEIINLSTNERIIKKVKTDKDGKLKIKLRDGTRYEINVSPKGYAFYNTIVDLVEEDAAYITDAKLVPLKKATKLELNDINFESNSADLNKSSFEELDRVVKLLITNPQIKIEISAHTDDVGSKGYNLKLSDRRAESVKEYLFSKDITENMIISKGYGEDKPSYLPFDNDENRAKNRRVELEVIDVKEE